MPGATGSNRRWIARQPDPGIRMHWVAALDSCRQMPDRPAGCERRAAEYPGQFFADPSLLVPQLVAATALALGMIHHFQGDARSVLLLFVAIFFGLLGLDTRRYLALTICIAAGYAALVTWELADSGATRHAWLMEALRFPALVVIWMSFIGGYFASIRNPLAVQRNAGATAGRLRSCTASREGPRPRQRQATAAEARTGECRFIIRRAGEPLSQAEDGGRRLSSFRPDVRRGRMGRTPPARP
ncbi:hypothetical protein MQC88_00910 [Luteimonas sp. 50]|uniref:Uncharacterized protein n=1 Tax=Cognatiluteimonas sedimenti TaxID=2927791 RepID=A0ABT0A0N9_9GAMM|nr:hypothetical protein [Lysobacter sedimenti]MCJ0824530.1 hypothetical protein [Lysobacter sedimenti]